MLREARDLRFDPSDGGGRAWLEQAEPAKPRVSSPGRFTIVYEAGPLGIADGGMIFLQVSPFWGWSTPQTFEPRGARLHHGQSRGRRRRARGGDARSAAPRHPGRGPAARRRRTRAHRLRGGPGRRDRRLLRREALALLDRRGRRRRRRPQACSRTRRASTCAAGPPARLLVTLPTTARPGETLRVCIAILDASGNAGAWIRRRGAAARRRRPASSCRTRDPRAADDGGAKIARGPACVEPGICRLRAERRGRARGESNPLVVSAERTAGALGRPARSFEPLRRHRHAGGLLPLRARRGGARRGRAHRPRPLGDPAARRPPRAVGGDPPARRSASTSRAASSRCSATSGRAGSTATATCSTSTTRASVFSSIDPRYESPRQLWDALEGQPALTFAHHSAGGPIRDELGDPAGPASSSR